MTRGKWANGLLPETLEFQQDLCYTYTLQTNEGGINLYEYLRFFKSNAA